MSPVWTGFGHCAEVHPSNARGCANHLGPRADPVQRHSGRRTDSRERLGLGASIGVRPVPFRNLPIRPVVLSGPDRQEVLKRPLDVRRLFLVAPGWWRWRWRRRLGLFTTGGVLQIIHLLLDFEVDVLCVGWGMHVFVRSFALAAFPKLLEELLAQHRTLKQGRSILRCESRINHPVAGRKTQEINGIEKRKVTSRFGARFVAVFVMRDNCRLEFSGAASPQPLQAVVHLPKVVQRSSPPCVAACEPGSSHGDHERSHGDHDFCPILEDLQHAPVPGILLRRGRSRRMNDDRRDRLCRQGWGDTCWFRCHGYCVRWRGPG